MTPGEIRKYYRDLERGGPPREVIPCGTRNEDGTPSKAPIRRHEHRGENPRHCEFCAPMAREIDRENQRQYRERKRKAKNG